MFEEGTGKLADQGCGRKDGVPEADNLVELEITEAGNPDETQDETDQNDGRYPGSTTRWEGADVIGSGSAVTGDLGLGPVLWF